MYPRLELDELAAQELQKQEFRNVRTEEAETRKKIEKIKEINTIFDEIQANLTMSNIYQSNAYQRELFRLHDYLRIFKKQLLNELETSTGEFPIKTARKLQDAVDAVLNPYQTAAYKDKVVNIFRNTARNARFSHDTKVGMAAVLGGLIALALWVGLAVVSGGTSALLTFAGLSVGALIVTFGVVHFAARGDSLMRNSNPHENRGKDVSDSLKALIRARKELHIPIYSSNETIQAPMQKRRSQN